MNGDVDEMDIKLIKELCEEHDALIETNKELGRVVEEKEDNYIKFRAVEGIYGDVYLSKKCIDEAMKQNVIRMNEIENILNSTEPGEDEETNDSNNTRIFPVMFICNSDNFEKVLDKTWVAKVEKLIKEELTNE